MAFRNVLLLFFTLSLHGVTAQDRADSRQFTVNGTIHQMNGKLLYLRYYSANKVMQTDSVLVEKDRFTFKGNIDQPILAILLKRNLNKWRLGDTTVTKFYIDPGSLHLSFVDNRFDKPRVVGSPTSDDRMALDSLREKINRIQRPISEAYDSLNQKYIELSRQNTSKRLLDAIAKKLDSLKEHLNATKGELTNIDTTFFKAHPSSVVTAYELLYYVDKMSSEARNRFYKQLGSKTQNGRYGKLLKERIDILGNGAVNTAAKDFEISGWKSPVKLSENRGKYVLLVFWASWCRPCRAENGMLDSLYSSYQKKGSNINFLGIGEERNIDSWKSAIKNDKIGNWQHGLGYNKNGDVANLYGVSVLPTKILIDPYGNIAGRYEGGDNRALLQKLNEVIDRK